MMKRQVVAVVRPACALLIMMAAGCGREPDADSRAHEYDDDREHTVMSGDTSAVRLDAGARDRLGLQIAEAGPGTLEITVDLPAEVQVNGDRLAHVAPRVGGVVRQVHVSLGDAVRQGQLLADLESRELADAKASFLAADERLKLADATYRREERLWREKVSSEQDYLDARKGRAEARIERRAAEQKLLAIGLPQSQLDGLAEQHDAPFTHYGLRAPFAGTVIDRHITIGETVSAGTPVLTVADLDTVWIDVSVFQKHIGSVHRGQPVRVATSHGDDVELSIDFVQPLVAEETRAALARIIAPNRDGIWHPGCFVTAEVTVSNTPAEVVVPASAVIRMNDGDEVVFIETDDGFESRIVTIGRRGRDRVEVLEGLEIGERYVASGGFSLKAELGKEHFGDGHGH